MIVILSALIVTNMAWMLLMIYVLKKIDTGVRQ